MHYRRTYSLKLKTGTVKKDCLWNSKSSFGKINQDKVTIWKDAANMKQKDHANVLQFIRETWLPNCMVQIH